MDPKALADIATKAMQAVKDQDGDTALQLLEQLLVALAGGTPDDSASSTPDAATAEGGDPQPSPAAAANSATLGAGLAALMGVNTEAEAVVLFNGMRTDVGTLRAQAAAADLAARRGMIAQLVKLGVEKPATAWAGAPDKMIPCRRLMVETLDEMRARVAAHSADAPNGGGGHTAVVNGYTPPVAPTEAGSREIPTKRGPVVLTASEIENCEQVGAKLEVYALNKSIREAARAGRV